MHISNLCIRSKDLVNVAKSWTVSSSSKLKMKKSRRKFCFVSRSSKTANWSTSTTCRKQVPGNNEDSSSKVSGLALKIMQRKTLDSAEGTSVQHTTCSWNGTGSNPAGRLAFFFSFYPFSYMTWRMCNLIFLIKQVSTNTGPRSAVRYENFPLIHGNQFSH